ncbi:low-density lipoprotein receptor-related protein 4 isoform X3 [Copidosoma floridanum]|uniref:low-density lipoprotein receptor-related protein 4 isoform X3 n=1 Tax=Copidosoma floridanum TaxID=29053 RepID=UPI000C6F453C|nr:low-density lipoprotein receptor-related protein 4 isoform X3 [Copidosoma floridanum]
MVTGNDIDAQTDSSLSTTSPVNRGAARQMFGSGSLRQTMVTSTMSPTSFDGDNYQRHDHRHDHGHDRSRNGHHGVDDSASGYGYDDYNRPKTPPQLPLDFYHHVPLPEPDNDDDHDDENADDDSSELPSFRNGAPGRPQNGMSGMYGQGRHPSSPGLYGGFDGGLEEYRARVRMGSERGHGMGQHGEAGDRLHTDRKSAVHELDDESSLACLCPDDQFLCLSTCTCIAIEDRCNGEIDCEGADDEIHCDVYNATCTGKRSVKCPTSGKCIAKEWLCDGYDDCGDYSDETHCESQKNCTSQQFECRNGMCIQLDWVCDGENDCKDFSDEENCDRKNMCFDTDFICQDTGLCIAENERCDGKRDCNDGSDELECEVEVECNQNQFQCDNPKCISMAYRCDGDDDCGDNSDEWKCPTANSSCASNRFRCANGDCISKIWVCDRENDCKDGDDELNCDYPTIKNCTSKDEFTCSNGHCIPAAWKCDGVPDCTNGEDEHDCRVGCELTHYLCKTSQAVVNETKARFPGFTAPWLLWDTLRDCIHSKHVCDGVPDCPEKDDEENCPTKVQCSADHACQHQCMMTTENQKICACNPGYVLSEKDNKTCDDINECEFQKDPVCSQQCVNTQGSFYCECGKGYVLRPDLRSCKAIGANPTLILANRIDIRQLYISGPKYTSVVKGLQNAIGLDYHYKRNLIFWSDVSMDVIRKVNVDGTNSSDFIRWGLEIPDGIAVDWIHDLIFWTDSGTRRVEVASIETGLRYVLVSEDLSKPRAIAVHPHLGCVYWTDWGTPKIERANMDGTDRTALVTENIYWPNGLTIDYTTDRIYWIDAKHRVIESITVNGDDRKKIVSRGLHHPFAITVFEDAVYWTDWHFKSISLVNKKNGRGFKTIHSGLHFPMDLRSFHPQRQPAYDNHCGNDNGKCSHMCLPTSLGYRCVCPVGMKISKGEKTCKADVDNILAFARKKDITMISLDQNKPFDVVIPLDNVESAVGLAWDPLNRTIYWTDFSTHTISRASLDGSNRQTIIKNNLVSPASLAIDSASRKLYWTDAGTNRIECSQLDGSMRSLLIWEGLDKPRDIVLHPKDGLMYWSDWGKSPKIEVAGMDGSNRHIFISANLTFPNGLAIDFEKKRLYWADGGSGTISYSDFNGKHVTTIISPPKAKHPFGLVIYKDKIYWTDWKTSAIHRADKDSGKDVTSIRSEVSGLMDVRVLYKDSDPPSKSHCYPSNRGCSHLCLPAPEPKHYTCSCPTGLVIKADKKTCPKTPTKFILMSHRYDIRVLSLDTHYAVDTVLPVSHMRNVSGADFDLETGNIYWTDPGQLSTKVIKKTSFEGDKVETVVECCIDTVDSIAVDSVGRKLYWTDAGLNSIEVSELDGKNRKVLVWSGLENPRAIALHYPAGLLFWTDWGHHARIEKADMDGEHRTAIVTEHLTWPNGLTIDLFADRIYWNDAKKNVIESSDLQGENRKLIVDKVSHPYGLAVVEDFLYWSDWHEKSLMRAKKSDGKNKKMVQSDLEGIMDLRFVDKNQVHPENACGRNNGKCSHLCLRNPNGFSCACPTGIIIKSDKRTCNSSPTNFLLLATKKSLVRMSLDTPEMWEVQIPVQRNHSAYSVDFHYEKQLIFYTDTDAKVIRKINLQNFNDDKVIVRGSNNSSPFRLAVDWIANNLYWTDMAFKRIEVSRLDGSNRKKLIENLSEPRSIALFPKEGYLYWTEWTKNAKIERANLDGSDRRIIVSSDLNVPNGLTIDYAARKLYWADALKDRIEVSDLHGRYRIALVPEASGAFGLAQYGNNIYWGDWFKQMIEKADKRTGKNRNLIRSTVNGTTEIRTVSAEKQVGWTPCAVGNGGCSHLCFFTRKNYTCGCPDQPDSKPCYTVPKKWVPLRKPGTENDSSYDLIDDEDIPPTPRSSSGSNRNQHNDFNKANKDGTTAIMFTLSIILLVITAIIVGFIIYLKCPRKNSREDYMYNNRRNVLTFTNPNYNASSAAGEVPTSNNQPVGDKKGFIWKRLKYDKSQRAASAGVSGGSAGSSRSSSERSKNLSSCSGGASGTIVASVTTNDAGGAGDVTVEPAKLEAPVKLQYMPLHFIQINETGAT